MAWTTIMCSDGPYQMNVEGVTRILRSYAYAKAVADSSTLDRETRWFGPSLAMVKTGWDVVPKKRDATIHSTGSDFYFRMSRNMTGKEGIAYLEGLIDDRNDYTDTVFALQQQATKETMNNVANSVERAEAGMETAKVIRNTAAEAELVLVSVATLGGAGLVSGTASLLTFTEGATAGAAATGIIAGSVGKGLIKWQDTGSIGKAVAEGYTELAFNSLTFGLKAGLNSATQKFAVGLLFGMVKGAMKMGPNAYLSPEEVAKGKKKSVAEWLLPSLANMPSAIAGDMVRELTKDPKWAIPATILLKMGLKYGADAIAKPTPRLAANVTSTLYTTLNQKTLSAMGRPMTGTIPSLKPSGGSTGDSLAAGRQALHSTHSSCMFDSARPSDEVVDSALRPIGSM